MLLAISPAILLTVTRNAICTFLAGKPVAPGRQYFAIFAFDAAGTKDVPRWGPIALAIAPPPPM